MTILVDVVKDVVSSMDFQNVHFEPGRALQIVDGLLRIDNSLLEANKYPLVAMLMPILEPQGKGIYPVQIDKIILATLTNKDDNVLKRYEEGGTFKSILYPLYHSFFRSIAKSPFIAGQDPKAFIHTKVDVPGVKPIAEGMIDFVDSIEILNLELNLLQIQNC